MTAPAQQSSDPNANLRTLDDLHPGEKARLERLEGARSFRRRLMELGLLPGAGIRLMRRADIGGVLEIEVYGCRLSLRRAEALQIHVASV